MGSTTAHGGLVPAWMEILGLSEESLRAAVTGLGVEIFGALCARAEPAPVRVRLCSLAARKFTFTMYAELCRFMESCRARRRSERVKDAEETRDHDGQPAVILRIDLEDDTSECGEQEMLNGMFCCTSCSQRFTTTAALKMHLRMHQVASHKRYKCTECSYCTDKKNRFLNHTWNHTREKPYTCTVCGKGFCSSLTQNIHMKMHMGGHRYVCKFCQKTFSYASSLKIHTSIHTGRKPYSCSVCGKEFMQLRHSKLHMQIHTGERPYSCKICAKKFLCSAGLKSHTRLHTREKPYSCSVCGKRFHRSWQCCVHTQIHWE